MLKMRILMVLTVAAVFAAGFWLGKERTSRAAAKDRVFELRTYTASEGNLQALHARFRNHTTKPFQEAWRAEYRVLGAYRCAAIAKHSDLPSGLSRIARRRRRPGPISETIPTGKKRSRNPRSRASWSAR